MFIQILGVIGLTLLFMCYFKASVGAALILGVILGGWLMSIATRIARRR